MVNENDIEKFLLEDYRIPMPEILHSVQHEGLFEKCIVCQCNLLDEDCLYMIEKGFKGDRAIFEYAICYQCRKQLTQGYSRESSEKIFQYCREKTDIFERHCKLLAKSKTSIAPWIEYCIFTGTPRKEIETYSIVARCQGSEMLFEFLPFMVSESAVEDIMKLLSKKTKDVLDDFTETYLGLGPEFANASNDFLLLI